MSQHVPTGEKIPEPTAADVPLHAFPTVELSEEQFQRAREIAESRNQTYEPIDGGRVCGDQTSGDVHLTGVVGEMAYAALTGNDVDESTYEYGDGGYDFESGSITIDTKTTQTHIDRPSLIVPIEPEPVADLYFLLHRIDTRTVRVIGFATYGTVTNHRPIRKPGDTLNYVVPQSELHLPPTLRVKIQDRLYSDV